MRAQKFDVTVRSTFPLTFIGVFFSYAMPGGVGGDVVKGFYLLKDQNHRKLAAATTIFMDRIVGLYAMTFLAAIAVMLNWNFVMNKPELRAIATGIFAAFLIFTVSFAFAFSNRVHVSSTRQKLFSKLPFGARLAEIYTSIHAYSQNLKAFTFAFLLSLASQLVTVAVFKIIGEAMGESVPWVTYAFVIPIGLIATAIPISPAGVGVGQAVFLVLFTWKLGRQTTLGPNLATSYQVLVFLWGLVGAYFYFTRKKPVIEEAA